jgi:hypothetical protein
MASIFFTERLPGISILQTAALFRRCARCASYPIVCPDGQPGKGDIGMAGEHEDPERVSSSLPQKQGLCQVVNGPCFWNVIRLLTGIREGVGRNPHDTEAYELGKQLNRHAIVTRWVSRVPVNASG